MSEHAVCPLPQTIIVPVTDPEKAVQVFKLAAALVDPDEGRIIALNVGLGNADAQGQIEHAIAPFVMALKAQGIHIELITHISTSIARGVLDTVREEGADLVILGAPSMKRGRVEIDSVAQNIAETAPCDVLIFRDSSKHQYSRIIVPASGSDHARDACRIGFALAQHDNKPLHLIHVQDAGLPHWQGLARIEQTLAGIIPPDFPVARSVVRAASASGGVLSRLDADDLLIVGSDRDNLVDAWLYGRVSAQLLAKAPGPVILVKNNFDDEHRSMRPLRRWLGWLRPTLTESEREEIAWQAYEMSTPTLDFFVRIIIAAFICALGLLLNNAGIVIGAMLVEPLMQPLTAFAISLTTGKTLLGLRALATVALGIAISLGIAFLTGKLASIDTPTGQMLANSSPTILDSLVAFAAGFIAAYATARKDISAALAGVAIATAVIPPLCTAGVGFALGSPSVGFGALLLFFINIINITLAAALVFLWLGLYPLLKGMTTRRRAAYFLMVALSLLTLPLVDYLVTHRRENAVLNREAVIHATLSEAFAPAALVSVEIVPGDSLDVLATLRAAEAVASGQVAAAETALESALSQPVTLGVVFQQVIRPDGE